MVPLCFLYARIKQPERREASRVDQSGMKCPGILAGGERVTGFAEYLRSNYIVDQSKLGLAKLEALRKDVRAVAAEVRRRTFSG